MASKGSGVRLSWSSLAEELAASWQQNNEHDDNQQHNTDDKPVKSGQDRGRPS